MTEMLAPAIDSDVARAEPLAKAKSIDPRKSGASHTSKPAHVLVVDDDESACDALQKLLCTAGFSTSTASNGVAALLEASRRLPDLVITDLTMPVMDGVELCCRLRELYPDLAVIVITARADTSSAIASLDAGVDDYLNKPVDLDVLVHRIERALDRRASIAELARLTEKTRLINERLVLSSIREQENAEAVQRQQAQLIALLENLSDGVLIADRSGRIVMVNRVAHELWLGGRVLHEVQELDALVTLRLDGTPCPPDERPLRRALRGEPFDRCEILRVRADGEVRRQITSGTSVRDSEGNVELAIVVFRDVTELRRLEKQRDEYVELISHDLRGPLNVIVISANVLKQLSEKNMPLDDTSIIERLARNAQRMNEMIAELLESAALESAHAKLLKEPFDLGAIVAGVISDLDEALRRRIVFEAGEGPMPVLVEPSKIERATRNLITNALKYSPDDAPVRVVLSWKAGGIALDVEDSGIGIAAADVPRIFERYYRAPTDGRFSGLGLGLYITRLIVEAHGGRIELVSEVGKGSTFTLFLPSNAA